MARKINNLEDNHIITAFGTQGRAPRSINAASPGDLFDYEPQHDEGIEQVEANGLDNKQVHGGNVWSVITQEGSPSLAGWAPSFEHVLAGARLRDLEPELEQFATDTWRTPKRIFDARPPDQGAQLRLDPRSPSRWTSNASISEGRPCANARASRTG